MNHKALIGHGSTVHHRYATVKPCRRALVIGAVLSGLLAFSAFAGASAQASTSGLKPMLLPPPSPPCPGVTFIGARGSGEPFGGFSGLGPAVDRMAGVLSSRLAKHRISMAVVPDRLP